MSMKQALEIEKLGLVCGGDGVNIHTCGDDEEEGPGASGTWGDPTGCTGSWGENTVVIEGGANGGW